MIARAFSGLAVSAAGAVVAWHIVAPMLALSTTTLAQFHGLLAPPVIPRMRMP